MARHRRRAERQSPGVLAAGGYIPSPTAGLSEVPLENYEYYLEALRAILAKG